ncbi:protein moonraker [Ornithorhynchus anatinus]|uniref:protein moonraker n=1 Tax=Ornithorhynchus anatinus TaxID=9258 RepID=UPI0010A85242|nr:protein moonraker [Ornithorhynchus anatinus]XP_028937937.1 protein moonraker [Ornithorhynchus anatinus]
MPLDVMRPSETTTSCVQLISGTQPGGKNAPQTMQTQLQFNRNVPAVPDNLAVRYSGPHPILIEKLKPPPPPKEPGVGDGPDGRSSVPFSVVSEEKLNFAIHLAKRDVKRRQLEEQVRDDAPSGGTGSPRGAGQRRSKIPDRGPEGSRSEPGEPLRDSRRLPAEAEVTSSGAKVYLYASQPGRSRLGGLNPPPARDPGPEFQGHSKAGEERLVREVRRLQKELRSYVRKIEDVVRKGRREEALDPDEERRGRVRRREGSVRSARTLYVLQQQVKEIQEELDKLSPHKIKHTKKFQAASRLAAAHRGAIRALQMSASQFSDPTEPAVPDRCRELGRLIRQLSLCSAKLGADPSVPDAVLDILRQIEDLNSLLEKKSSPRKGKPCFPGNKSRSPATGKLAVEVQSSPSPQREKKPPVSKERLPQEAESPAVTRNLPAEEPPPGIDRSENCTSRSPPDSSDQGIWPREDPPPPPRNAAFKTSVGAPMRTGAGQKGSTTEPWPLGDKGVLLPPRVQGSRKPERSRRPQPPVKNVRFLQTTVASRLKKKQPPVRDRKKPWIPPSPTSPPASPKCAAWGKVKTSPTDTPRQPPAPRRKATRRGGSLGAVEQEAVRSEGASAGQLADRVEKVVLERLKPLLDRAQKVNFTSETNTHLKDSSSVNRLSTQTAEQPPLPSRLTSPTPHAGKALVSADGPNEDVPGDLLEAAARGLRERKRPQLRPATAADVPDSPTLETMLERMEEMEQHQEAVRRRYHQILYADPRLWTQGEKMGRGSASVDRRPSSPRPIRITRTVGHRTPEVDIVLEQPSEGILPEEGAEVAGSPEGGRGPGRSAGPRPKRGGVPLSVPRAALRSIEAYSGRYAQHLKMISHEPIGSFDPWRVAESLAEELLDEALGDVAAELRDVCEDYAEAVFTSEFLEPAE